MSAVELHNVGEAVEQLRAEVLEHRPVKHTWAVLGEPTAGKSAVLDQLHQELSEVVGVKPILLNPPQRAYDAAHVALIELAEALTDDDSKLAVIRDPERPWSDKLSRVRGWLGRDPSRVVLLADDPYGWAPREGYFRSFVFDIHEMVFDGLAAATVTAGRPPFRVSHFHPLHLEPASDPAGVLTAIDAAVLAAAKEQVAVRFHDVLGRTSPLQTRLLVAIAALDESALERIDPTLTEHRAELVGTLLDLVDSNDDVRLLRDVWLRLAAVRESFEEDLLSCLGGDGLSHLSGAIMRQCLLFRRHDRLVLHESLRRIPSMTERLPSRTHELLAEHYREKFAVRGGDVGGRLRDAVEAFHHASSAGIVDFDKYRPFFVDQLNILGYHLSFDQQDWEQAAEVFGVALHWEPRNAYASHYRAFNLDQLAVNPDEVEALYRLAIEEAPWHIWFRSRLITFLIAEARIDEAWREWLRAIEEIDWDGGDQIYYWLHLHVARSLLYRGELTLVQAVLRGVPREVRHDGRFAALQERLETLQEARDVGSFVPAPYLRPGWWSDGPNLLRGEEGGRQLTRWLAGRVTEVAENAVELDVADILRCQAPVYGGLELPKETLGRWWRGPGDVRDLREGIFIEIGFYGEGDDPLGVAVGHPRVRWPDLTSPDEDPDRYLRAATAA